MRCLGRDAERQRDRGGAVGNEGHVVRGRYADDDGEHHQLDTGRYHIAMGVDPSNARRTGQINSIQLLDPRGPLQIWTTFRRSLQLAGGARDVVRFSFRAGRDAIINQRKGDQAGRRAAAHLQRYTPMAATSLEAICPSVRQKGTMGSTAIAISNGVPP